MARPASELARWTPFQRAELPRENLVERLDRIDAIAQDFDAEPATVRRTLEAIDREETIWLNSRYQVNVRTIAERDDWPAMVHLSIKRRDHAPIGTERYRDLMRIKDELVGPEHEALELYPARSREVDTSTQYHLWVVASDRVRFPFGWNDGRRVHGPIGLSRSGAFQNPFEAHHPR